MIRNYIKISTRYILKEGIYSVIKIFGLATGLAASLIIGLFVLEDLSFDQFHSKKDRIVRVLTIDSAQGVQSQDVGVSQPALGHAAMAEIPEVVSAVRVVPNGVRRLRVNDQEFKSEQSIDTESAFFEIFDFEIVEGQRDSVLNEPRSVVLTESLAKKLFGNESPIGKSLQMGTAELNIKAVMKDPPPNSHLQFDMVGSLVAPEGNEGWQNWLTSWGSLSCFNYLLLNEPKEDLQPIIDKLIDLKTKNEAAEFFTPTLQKLNDVHLRSEHILFESNHAKSDINKVYIMISISLVILILASVNFMNLVTAKSSNRAKEMGVRKVMGGLRNQLIYQHLTESILIVLLSFIAALMLTSVSISPLNMLYNRQAEISVLWQPEMILAMLAFLILLGIFAGAYPAFILSAFRPSNVLKGTFKSGKTGQFVRKGLVIFQFIISISLIVGAGVIFQQMDYIQKRNMGYERERVVSLALQGQAMRQHLPVLREELLQQSSIINVGTSSVRIGQQLGRNSIYPEGRSEEENFITSAMTIDDRYLNAMKMEIMAGRNFNRDSESDSASAILINQELARMLEWSDPVGKIIRLNTGQNTQTEFTVIGVVKDFNFATVQHPIEPVYMRYNKQNGVVAIKLAKNIDINQAMADLEGAWKKVFPQNIFEYSFLDDDFNALYEKETAFANMFSHLTILAILIAILGLFGLSAFAVEQRTKEIGVRKVLGARVGQLVAMLSKEFIVLVTIAFVLACPIAWYGMTKWLESFVYRIDIGVMVFVISAIITITVTILTVIWQSFKAATASPAISLRDE
ncbi:ABC transporter permease [Fulvivirgaceae bacterium BMA10]|uniref:ABC transporter permease n=1 Tax=Splendidivirga corallicola TaxID=3051826 RepID=A0ABT8KX23_9BACT|nr:ABC transporter permease [Fulvivirgaceae bacterium BMA10]